MLNNMFKLFSTRKLPITVFGLLFTLGVVGEQIKPVLSNEIQELPTSATLTADLPESTTQSQISNKTPLVSRLREVREQRSQLGIASFESEAYVSDSPEHNLQISSANLSKNIKAVATNTALKATKEPGVKPRANFPTKDGVYLYGQSPQPNQLGQGYVLFQKQQGKVMGALYMPQSEFSCFQGTLDKSGELAMTVTSPDPSLYNEVATGNRLPKFDEDGLNTYAYSVALQDYHRVNSISANDQRILQMCNQSSADVYTKLVK